jgi:hypothetical protein
MSACGGSVGKVSIPYYVVPKGRRNGYWRPNEKMRALGFRTICCGPDGPAAWGIAKTWTDKWEAVRCGREPPPLQVLAADNSAQTNEARELARRWPPGSVGEAWQRYIQTEEWGAKALSTRNKIWWPSWFRIRDMWGDVAPDTITYEQLSAWRVAIRRKHGPDTAHKTIKVWRALWKVMGAMKIATGKDPSAAIRNVAPKPRHQRWSEGEAVRLVKAAIRRQRPTLACIIAVTWDSLFSPVDVRTLRARHVARADGRLVFDRSEEGRTKTGRPAYGTVSRRTERLLEAQLHLSAADWPADALLFRAPNGKPYREDTLAKEFARLREEVFPGDKRQLRDMRRAGTVEIFNGQPETGTVSAKLANSVERSNQLAKTYNPTDLALVVAADEARQRGRQRLRDGTNRVEKLHAPAQRVTSGRTK